MIVQIVPKYVTAVRVEPIMKTGFRSKAAMSDMNLEFVAQQTDSR